MIQSRHQHCSNIGTEKGRNKYFRFQDDIIDFMNTLIFFIGYARVIINSKVMKKHLFKKGIFKYYYFSADSKS